MAVVDIALCEIADSDGSRELETIRELSVDDDDPSTPVKTMNRGRRSIGYTAGVPDFKFTLTVAELVGAPEVDWQRKMRTKEQFLFTYEEGDTAGARRFSFAECRVTKVSKPFKMDGEMFKTVDCVALDHRPDA